MSTPDPHAFLVKQADVGDIATLFKRWKQKGGEPKAVAEALGDMKEFPHVREWIRQMKEAVRG